MTNPITIEIINGADEESKHRTRRTTGTTNRTEHHGDHRHLELTTNQSEKGRKNMSRNQITTTLSEPGDENAYLAELEGILRRMVGKRTKLRIHQAEDFVQYFVVWAWGRPDLMERYVPRALASTSFTQRLIDFLRQEGRQLPQGEYDHKSHKVVDSVWYLDHVLADEDGEVFTFGDTLEADNEWLEEILANDIIAGALEVLSPEQREIYLLVEGLRYKVTEVAAMFGYKREWTQRELGKAREILAIQARIWK